MKPHERAQLIDSIRRGGWIATRDEVRRLLEDEAPTNPGATAVLHVDTDEEPQDNTEALS